MSGIIKTLVLRKRHREIDQTERARFLAEARGPAGPAGLPGPQGERGLPGKPGRDGKDGKDGATIIVRSGGGGGSELTDLIPGAAGAEPVGVAVMQGSTWTNLPWPAFISMVAGAVDVGADLSRRTDLIGDSLIYRGEATPGTDDATPAWRIKRIEFLPEGNITEKFAGGTAERIHAWSDRVTLTYS